MRSLLRGDVFVDYGTITVLSEGLPAPGDEAFHGQRNGLCGAAVSGALSLVTGLHTGLVGFAVELHDEAPALDASWAEVVEVSFRPEGPAAVVSWEGEQVCPLGLAEGWYRVRYCASGMDEGHDQPGRDAGEPEVDRYLLQFWPAPPGPDAVLRQTGEVAAYRHSAAR
jgi:hypothetical protein